MRESSDEIHFRTLWRHKQAVNFLYKKRKEQPKPYSTGCSFHSYQNKTIPTDSAENSIVQANLSRRLFVIVVNLVVGATDKSVRLMSINF